MYMDVITTQTKVVGVGWVSIYTNPNLYNSSPDLKAAEP